MKDSQLMLWMLSVVSKYIKANNERFSTGQLGVIGHG